jgi:subtilase family serine protease
MLVPGWKLRKFAGVTAVVFGTMLGSVALASTPHELRLGQAPRRPLDSHELGRLAAATKLDVLMTLKPQTGLAAYAHAISTPGSSLYHHYLSVSQFRERFGASQATIDAVTDSLRTAGLDPGRVSADGLGISVDASSSELSRAFETSFERLRLPSGRVAFTNTSAPELAAAVGSHIQAILGLNSLNPPISTDLVRDRSVRRSATHVRAHISSSGGPTNSCIPEGSAGNPDGSYWNADQIAQAYGLNSYYAAGDDGAGETIGLIELEPNLASDIATYETCYGLSGSDAPAINYTEVDGGAGSGAGSGEAALDIEQVIGLAPQATVDVYQAPNFDTNSGFVAALQAMVDNSAINVISDSWGACESYTESFTTSSTDISSENVLFEQAATEGKSVFAASGDTGSSGCWQNDQSSAPAVSDPGSQPYVTGTGGTSLTGAGTTPTPVSQSVWNDGGDSDAASGGGVSSVWPMPTWQSTAAGSLNVIGADSSGTPCQAASGSYCREVPDVSADGDPETGYAIYCSSTCAQLGNSAAPGDWLLVGGTSAVAPLWAAYAALVNDSSVCNRTAIGFANPLLYEAADDAYASDFNDIANGGNNDAGGTGYEGGLYPVGSGYDMATGLGTPIGGPLGNTLCDEADTVTLGDPAAQTTTVGVAVNLALVASDSEGHGVSGFSAAGLPAGLSISASTGVITGAPTLSGRYNVAVTATASITGASTSKSFSWQVVAVPTTKATTFKLGDQLLTLTTPILDKCLAPSAAYKVRFRSVSHSGQPKLKFKSVAYYLDKGVKRVRTETSTVHGKKRAVKVTTIGPNATSHNASSSASIHLKGVHSGTQTLRLVITYSKTTKSRGKTKLLTVIKQLTVKFKVC